MHHTVTDCVLSVSLSPFLFLFLALFFLSRSSPTPFLLALAKIIQLDDVIVHVVMHMRDNKVDLRFEQGDFVGSYVFSDALKA